MSKKINWIYEGEAGCWHSGEHRFTISPGGWRGGVTPDHYELNDAIGGGSNIYDTVGEAKMSAQHTVNQYEKSYYGFESDVQRSKRITEELQKNPEDRNWS